MLIGSTPLTTGLDTVSEQHSGEGVAGELAPLIRVEYLWCVLAQRLLQRIHAGVFIQRV